MNGRDDDTGPLDPGQALQTLTSLARDELPPPQNAEEAARAYERFHLAQAHDGGPARRRARLVQLSGLGVGAVALAALALVVIRAHVAPHALTVRVEGGAVVEGGYVRATTSESAPDLRFSDGTEVKLAPASRARVAETDHRGARVLLDDGHARAQVVPRKGSRWVFDAGPCRVQVTGTRFDLFWSAAHQLLEVWLTSGGVIVKGPPAVEGVPMRAGQRLIMDVRRGSVRFEELPTSGAPGLGSPRPAPASASPTPPPEISPPAPPSPAAELEPAAPGALPAPPSPGPPRRAPTSPASSTGAWPARILSGDFRGVVDDAERRGVGDVLQRESAGNLMALADAARYAGASRLAGQALAQVRRRYPGSPSAHRAAFLLGRMAEDQDKDLSKALDWYGIYLAGADGDPRAAAFRDEALGRQLTATLRLHGVDRARPLALEYLRRHPGGAYAQAARAIIAP